jgi:ligand-binding SRPBCC domain-containing protein
MLNARRQGEYREAEERYAPDHTGQNIERMGTIRLETLIKAPSDRCFDLARSVEAHIASTPNTAEKAVGGRKEGLFEVGDSVIWEARHFGFRLRQGSTITRSDRPHIFVDEGTSGPLDGFRHVHQFIVEHDMTRMVDTFEFELAWGLLGRLADRLVVERHLRRLLTERAAFLKAAAEAAD